MPEVRPSTHTGLRLKQRRRCINVRWCSRRPVVGPVFIQLFGPAALTGKYNKISDGRTFYETRGFYGTLWVPKVRFVELPATSA